MGPRSQLPKALADLIYETHYIEFVTVSKAGAPINTPCLVFPQPDLSTIDVGTGVAYPAKAERLRRNPKAAFWVDGVLPGEPVAQVVGYGATLDADIESNALRYIAETGIYGSGISIPWSGRRHAIWYWSRLIMRVAPKEILWWDSAADLDREPHRWEAPAGTAWPASDPAPAAPPAPPSAWATPPWREVAQTALAYGLPGHLSLLDADGFPRPAKVRDIELTADGFDVTLPKHAPGERNGPANLSFMGFQNFVGEASAAGGRVRIRVDRALPQLPVTADPDELWAPKPDTRAALMARLEGELGRRGQALPAIPEAEPTPTAGAQARRARLYRMKAAGMAPAGWDLP
jgi:hypothetical protein